MKTHVLRSDWQQSRGVIGRYPDPDEEYVFEFDGVARRFIHMVGVRRPLRVEWYIGDGLQTAETLRAWLGWGYHKADRVIERRPSDL